MYKKIIIGAAVFSFLALNASAQANKYKLDSRKLKNTNTGVMKADPNGMQSVSVKEKNTNNFSNNDRQKVVLEDDITGFKETPNGLLYKFIKKGTSNKKANVDDLASLNIEFKMGDTVIINSKKINDNKPVIEQIKSPKYAGDVNEGILMMKPGDVAIFKMLLTDLEARTNHPTPPFVKNGKYASWTIEMTDLKTKSEMADEEKLLVKKDEDVIKAYLAKNKLKGERLESGVYIVRHKKGEGITPIKGQTVTVNYTGKLMDGTSFDSNVDPKFNHVSPFQFPVGTGRVIKGWDEAFLQMKKGEKATIYIPSALAYGKHSPSKDIPANSILVFDVELVDF